MMKLFRSTMGLCWLLFHEITIVDAVPGLCRDGVTTGYDDFNVLKKDIEESSSTAGDPRIFTICPNTVLTTVGDDWGIQFPGNGDYTLQCGDTGERANNCVLQGGPRHLSPGHNTIESSLVFTHNIYVSGMTFRGATNASVQLQASSIGSYTFIDCLWEENLRGIFARTWKFGSDKTLKIQNSAFVKNEGYLIDGFFRATTDLNLEVDNCVFMENESDPNADKNDIIYNGNIKVTNCCFVGNEVNQRGALVWQDSNEQNRPVNTNNYARDNTIVNARCDNGIWYGREEQCLPFDAPTCIPEPCLSEDPPCSVLPVATPEPTSRPDPVVCDVSDLGAFDPSGQCSSELDALQSCALYEYSSESQCTACRICVMTFLDTYVGVIDSRSCSENEAIFCRELNKCDDDCGTCADELEKYFECLWMRVSEAGAGCGGFDCDDISSVAAQKVTISHLVWIALLVMMATGLATV